MESINRDRAVPDADLATPSRALFFSLSTWFDRFSCIYRRDAAIRFAPRGSGVMYILTLVTRRVSSCSSRSEFLSLRYVEESFNFLL